MQITEIITALKDKKIEVDESSLNAVLSTNGLDANTLTPPMLEEMITDGVFGGATPAPRGRGKKKAPPANLAKTEPAPEPEQPSSAIAKSEANDMATQPPVEQGEPVEEIKIEVPAQAIASVENMAVGMVLQIDSEVDAMATSVARLANNAGALFAYKLNQKIGMQSGVNEAESLARHGDAWSASRSRINDLISNIQQGAIAS